MARPPPSQPTIFNMIDVVFYKFQKKPNSTARPSSGGTTLSCSLIENTNILAPKIRVHAPINFLAEQYNYIYISAFNRYYYINDPVWALGTWTYSCSIDVLATYRTEIGASTEYVQRSAYEFDGDIIDTAYVTKTSEYVQDVYPQENETYQEPDTIYGPRPSLCFIVGIIGGLPQDVLPNIPSGKTPFCGSVVYYVLGENQLRQLIEMILGSVNAYQVPITELSEELQKQLIDPMQYIHSIRAMPTRPNTLNTEVTSVQLGFNELEIPYSNVGDTPYLGGWHIMCSEDITDPQPTYNTGRGYLYSHRCDIHLPLHPAYTDKGHFVCGAPYSKYVFHVEPFGDIELSSGDILSSMITYEDDPISEERVYFINVHVDTLIDFVTGDTRMHIWALSAVGKVTFAICTQNIGVDVPYHQTVQDIMGFRQALRGVNNNMISSFLNIGTNVITGGLLNDARFSQSNMSPTQEATLASGEARAWGGAINATVQGIEKGKAYVDQATQANQVSVSGSNTVGSFMAFCRDLCTPVVHCYFTNMVDEYRPDMGRPLMSPRQLSTIPGYILCRNSHFLSDGTFNENRLVEAYMDGGFYYE